MGARAKLNAAALNGALLIGFLVACATGDLGAGLLVGSFVVVIQLIGGDIRPSRRQ